MINQSKKVFFKDNNQSLFLSELQNQLNYSNDQIASLLGICTRTWRDWKRGKFQVGSGHLEILCKKASIPIPENIILLDKYWYVHKGAKLGGQAIMKKCGRVGGDSELRLQKWHKWWSKNKHNADNLRPGLSHPKHVSLPTPSELLAEFFGIMIGDGGMSRNQIMITLHSEDDLEYSKFVSGMILELFGVSPGVTFRKNAKALTLFVSRVNLVRYLATLGLKIGDKLKQNLDIPNWITDTDQYAIKCIRGLFDTDGCTFTHSYIVNGKRYAYKKVSFTSASENLISSVYQILRNFGFNPRVNKFREVRLESQADVKRYFELVNSSNPKHLKKYLYKLK